VLAGITILFLISAVAARFIGSEFFPATDESQFTVLLQEPQGTAVQTTSAAATDVVQIIGQVISREDITTITTNAGVPSTGIVFGANQGPNYAQINVRLVAPTQRKASTDELAARVRRALDGKFPGVQFFITLGGIQRQVVNIGAAAPIDVQVIGYDQTAGAQLAQQVAAAVALTPGTADVRIVPQGQYPSFAIQVDSEKAALLGLSPTAVANAITLAMSGNPGTASKLIDPFTGDQFGIVTRLMDRYRTHPEDLANVPLETLVDPLPGGGPSPTGRTAILLRDVARVTLGSEPLQLSRKNEQRVIDVTANVTNRPLGSVSADIVQALARIRWPVGFSYHMAGQVEQQQGAFGSLGLASGLALMLVYMIMASQFKSLVDPFVIMFTVPLGLIGVIWMLLLTHVTLSIMSFMGTITMVGIVVSNGILLIDFANKLQERGLPPRDAILAAGRMRLRPILMTALAFILGVLPLAISVGAGAGARRSVGTGVMGGMLAATFLAIFFVPWFFRLIFERRITEPRTNSELHDEIERARVQHEHAHPPHARARQARANPGGDHA
jgi:multidrug efflux pump subunit AcrB